MKIIETEKTKILQSPNYNYVFNKENGFFMKYGSDAKDNPSFSPFGPEIADIEISTICHGPGTPCSWCYKSNTPKGENMSFETFKKIFHKLPRTLTQIAFGIGDLSANKDIFKILTYCKKNDYNYVVPNITINGYGLNDEWANSLVHHCGAIAVSHYDNEVCFDAVKLLTDCGLKQTNIHKLLSEETFDSCLSLIDKAKSSFRLKKLNAIVFLVLKPKGKRNTFHTLKSVDKFQLLIDYAKRQGILIGFDSCSAPSVLRAAKNMGQQKIFETFVESCESFHFSIYINTKGEVFPCSFCEGEKEHKPLNMIDADFINDIWMGKEAQAFRKNMKSDKLGSRMCPQFDLYEKEAM